MKGRPQKTTGNEEQKVFFVGLSSFMETINQYLSEKHPLEPLGKHIKISGGYAFKSSEYKSSGIPIIRISDFQDEKIDLSNVQFYDESEEYDKYQLKEGDIIIALTGGTIGKLGIVQKGLGKLYLNQRVGKFEVLHPKEFFDKYVYWLARSVQEKVKSFGYGGAQPNISGSQIEEIQFPIPDKETQERIVEFLEDLKENKLQEKEYFNKKTENEIKKLMSIAKGAIEFKGLDKKNIDYISKLRQSILQSAVQGKLVKQDSKDESANELLKKIRTEKEKLIKEGKIRKDKPLSPISENEIPYELPKGWEWVRLGDVILSDIGGGTPSKNKSDYWNGGIPWASVKDLNEDMFLTKTQDNISELGLKNSSSNLIPKDNLIICTRMGLGKILFNKIEVSINQDLRAVFLSKNMEKFYFYHFYKTLSFIHSGTTVSGIRRERLLDTPFPLPPFAEQKRIIEKVNRLMAYCDELEKQVKENQGNAEKLMSAVLKEGFEEC